MTVDWCPNRRQKFWTGSRCCHDRGTNKARTPRYSSGKGEEDVILAKESRDRPRKAAEFGLRHETRAGERVKLDLSFFGIAALQQFAPSPHWTAREDRPQTFGRDK
jgi:hypothetical protein